MVNDASDASMDPNLGHYFLLAGAFLLVLTGLFLTILSTSDDPSEGLADTATWFGWAGTSLVGVALLFKALASHGGVRAAYASVGSVILVNSVAGAGLLSSFFGAF